MRLLCLFRSRNPTGGGPGCGDVLRRRHTTNGLVCNVGRLREAVSGARLRTQTSLTIPCVSELRGAHQGNLPGKAHYNTCFSEITSRRQRGAGMGLEVVDTPISLPVSK